MVGAACQPESRSGKHSRNKAPRPVREPGRRGPPGDLDFYADSPGHLDAPFLPDPDPPAAHPGSFDRDPLPPEEFADPPAPD